MTDLVAALTEGMPPWLTSGAAGWEITAADDDVRIALPGGAFPLDLPGALGDWPADTAACAHMIENLAASLAAHHPRQIVKHFPAFIPFIAAAGQGEAPISARTAWMLAVRMTEAGRHLLTQVAATGDLSAAHLLPLVRRGRFLLLSAPARYQPTLFLTERVLGSERALLPRLEQATEEWALDLLNSDTHPLIRRLPPAQFERDLRRLVFVHDVPTAAYTLLPPPVAPSLTSPTQLAETASWTAWIVREGFLPRFMLRDSWRATKQAAGRRWQWLLLPPVLLALLLIGIVVGFTAGRAVDGSDLLHGIAGAAAGAFLAMAGLAVWQHGTVNIWCLRLPAGAAIGLAALVALPTGWATPHWSTWGWAAGALTVAAAGYLTLEALAHGAPRLAAVRHALAVTVLGLAHAVGVAALLFAAVVPAVAPDLATALARLSGRAMAAELTLAAGVGLAAGVFLQVLWDDRPVTYPLSHLPRKGRERA